MAGIAWACTSADVLCLGASAARGQIGCPLVAGCDGIGSRLFAPSTESRPSTALIHGPKPGRWSAAALSWPRPFSPMSGSSVLQKPNGDFVGRPLAGAFSERA